MALEPISKAEHHTPNSEALTFFLSSIQDPNNPRHCGTCLNGAFLECTGDTQWWQLQYRESKFKSPPQYNPELWDRIVNFLFIPRSGKEMENLLNRLSQCNCQLDQDSKDVQRYHNVIKNETHWTSNMRAYNLLSIQNQPDETKGFAVSWNSFLANLFLALSTVIGRASIRSSAKGKSSFWPIRLSDLIPFGADSFVGSMAYWYFTIPDPVIFRLTAAVLQVAGELVAPSLVKYRFTEIVVESTRRSIERVMREHLMNPNPKPGPTYAMSIFPCQATDVLVYFKTILDGSCMDDIYKVYMFHGCETKAVQQCSLLLYISEILRRFEDSPDFHARPNDVAEIGQELFRYFSLHTPSRPPFPVHPLIQEIDAKNFPPLKMSSPLSMTAFLALRNFRLETRCSAQGCLNTLHVVGKEFRRCGNCLLAPYCGRECQKKAWKNPFYPHKLICPILQKLIEKAGGHDLFFSGIRELDEKKANRMLGKIYYRWCTCHIDPKDLVVILDWESSLKRSRGHSWPLEEKDLSPGYSDYEELLDFLSSLIPGPKPVYLEPLARWPEEVAGQLQLLILQPFRGQEIDG